MKGNQENVKPRKARVLSSKYWQVREQHCKCMSILIILLSAGYNSVIHSYCIINICQSTDMLCYGMALRSVSKFVTTLCPHIFMLLNLMVTICLLTHLSAFTSVCKLWPWLWSIHDMVFIFGKHISVVKHFQIILRLTYLCPWPCDLIDLVMGMVFQMMASLNIEWSQQCLVLFYV